MKRGILNSLASAGIMLGLCLHSSSAEAIFASVKSTGMAAACISYPIDTLAGAYNPAGMTDVGDRLDLEGGWVHSNGHAHVSNNMILVNGVPTLNPVTNGTFDGMKTKNSFPFGAGINKVWEVDCDWEIATGVILYNRNYQKTTYGKSLPLLGTSKPGIEYLNETVSPIIAVKWCNSHSIGISLDYQLERLKVNGIENFKALSIFPEDVTNRGYDYSSGWGVTIGYHGQITDYLSIGLTYQPETSMKKMDKYKGFLANGRMNIPRKIGAGISYRMIPCLLVAFDVEQIQWSKIRALHNPFLHDGHLAPLGSENGPGFGFRDQVYYRLGLEWQVDECWTVRAGYRYANTPVRSSQTPVNLLLLDLVQDFATFGVTWNIDECNELSGVFAYGFEHSLDGKGAIPPFLGGGNAKIDEEKFAVGLAWGLKF